MWPPFSIFLSIFVGLSSLVATFSFLYFEAEGTSNDLDVVRDLVLFSFAAIALVVNLLKKRNWARFSVVLIAGWLAVNWLGVFFLAWTSGETFYEGLFYGLGYLITAGLLFTPPAADWFPAPSFQELVDDWHSLPYGMRVNWVLFLGGLLIDRRSAYGGGGNVLFALLATICGTTLFVIYCVKSNELASKSNTRSSVELLLLSVSLLVIAVYYPASTLSLLYLVTFPIQILCSAVILANLLMKTWNAPQISKLYLYSLVVVNIAVFSGIGLAAFSLLNSGLQLH